LLAGGAIAGFGAGAGAINPASVPAASQSWGRFPAQFPFLDFTPPDEFPPSPLELIEADPLLPEFPLERELTSAERAELAPALDDLDRQALAQFNAGNKLAAYALWNRELRLRRFLGPLAEIAALGRVGAIAWQDGETLQVQLITMRLKAIQVAESPPTPEPVDIENPRAVLPVPEDEAIAAALGQAYNLIRAPQPATVIYADLRSRAAARGDRPAEAAYLEILGQLHLDWLNYGEAETVYLQLLEMERQNIADGNFIAPPPFARPPAAPNAPNLLPEYRVREVGYLKTLVFIADQQNHPRQAITYRQDLITVYSSEGLWQPLPALQAAIAARYVALDRLDLAERTYQEAQTTATQLQQLDVLKESLLGLASLYQRQNPDGAERDRVLQTYIALLEVAQQSYDGYGMMDTYDRIGDLFVEAGDYAQAAIAYEQGAILAGQLKHRETYFARKLATLRDLGPPPLTPDSADPEPTTDFNPSPVPIPVDPGPF
jgi:tetratricopeptide (TPR) repeat protein